MAVVSLAGRRHYRQSSLTFSTRQELTVAITRDVGTITMLPPEPDYAVWITWLCDKNMNLAQVFLPFIPALNADGFFDGGVVSNISVPPEGFCPSAPPVPL